MFTKSEALIMAAAVAVAMLPKVESKVQQFASQHRTEIQMAMNELQGKPAIPFAAPAMDIPSIPDVEADIPAVPELQLVPRVVPMEAAHAASMRAEMARARARIAAARAVRAQVVAWQPQLVSLRTISNQRHVSVNIYRLAGVPCPKAPAITVAPVAPVAPVIQTEDSSSF